MANTTGNKFIEGIEITGRPPLYDDPDKLINRIGEYFDNNDKYTITGLCLYLGFSSRQSFYDYEERDAFSYIIKRARLVIESMYEEKLITNTPTGAIFALKNMGWIDKQEVKHEGTMVSVNVGDNKAKEGVNYVIGEINQETK